MVHKTKSTGPGRVSLHIFDSPTVVVWTLQLKLNSHAVTTHPLPHPTQATVQNHPFEGWTQLLCGIIAIATQHIPEIEAKRQLGLRHGDRSILGVFPDAPGLQDLKPTSIRRNFPPGELPGSHPFFAIINDSVRNLLTYDAPPPATGLGHHYPVWSIGVLTSPWTDWSTPTGR